MAEFAKVEEQPIGAGTFRLPKQAQDNADNAEKLLESFGIKEPDVVPDSVVPDTVVPAAEPDAVIDQGAVVPVVEPVVDPAAPVAVAVVDDTPVTPEARVIELTEELRISEAAKSTLQGKYNSELPRLQQDFDEFKQSVSGQVDLLSPAAPVVPDTPALEEKIAALKETYDPEMVDAFLAVMGDMSTTAVNTAVQPVADKVASAEEVQLAESRKTFNTAMDVAVENYDWQRLFTERDPAFLTFLQQPTDSGLHTYDQLIRGFSQNFDHKRMAIVINKFRESQGVAPVPAVVPAVVDPATPATPAAEVVPAVPATPVAQPKTDNIVAPNRTAPSMPAVIADNEMRIWTPESQAQFEVDDRDGKYTTDQSTALWNDLLMSTSEGRYRAR